ncbi:MAG: DUF167 domain-containing protein [Ktedonobacteraceae bacterium]
MLITVRVIPRSSKNEIAWEQGGLKVRLTAAPVDGAANEALIRLLAKQFGLHQRAIRVVRGATSRQKVLEMDGIAPDEVKRLVLNVL